MKRLLIPVLALVLALSLALPMTGSAEDSPEPFSVELCAGKHTDVGNVTVWNDGVTLYVQYNTEDGWMLKETHLEVTGSVGGIPQTKKGNPIPGHFEQGDEYEPPVGSDTFEFDLLSEIGFVPCPLEVYIAAHAVVVGPNGEEETAWGAGCNGSRISPRPKGNWGTYFIFETCFYELTDAEWEDDGVEMAAGDPQGSEARIRINLPDGTTLGDIEGTSISWTYSLTSGYPPHVDIKLDYDNDGVDDDALVFEYAYNTLAHYAEWGVGTNPYNAQSGGPFQTFNDDGDGPNKVDDNAMGWLSSGPSGPPPPHPSAPDNFGTLANWKAGKTVTNSSYGPVTIDEDTMVTAIEIEIDSWLAPTEASVQGIMIDLAPTP